MARRRPRPATEAQAPSPAFSEEALTLELEPGLIPEAVTWSRRKGEKVKVGTEIAQVKCSMKGKTGTKVKKLVASRTGTIESLEEPKLGEEPPGEEGGRLVLGRITFCTHPYRVHDRVCAVCGEVVQDQEGTTTRVFVQGGHHVSVSKVSFC